ncbi:MAG: hypothetical protein J5769_07310 [Bacteroidales bacterium]|nr:hypothetical protein [Bacteroidales bacterium]
MKTERLLLAALLVLLSCERVDVPSVSGDDTVYHGLIELGERLEDPYSVDNITKALENLYPSKGRVEIEPTDLYMRFLPQTEDEYRLLESSVSIISDHPLDYRIVREGDYYHDPSLPEGDITWQYVVVPKDYKAPSGLRCELIDKCYISEHDAVTRASDIDWAAVEREAFRITGNESLLEPETKAASVCPAGRITVVDPVLNEGKPFGVAEVMVVCNSFVKFSSAYTDRDGYYEMPVSFSSEPRYRLVFKNRKGFSLGLNLVLLPASISTLGKGSPEGKDACVMPSDDGGLYRRCVVNNSAYDYYSRCVGTDLDIPAPPRNLSIWILGEIKGGSAAMLHQGVFTDLGQLSEKYGKYADLLNIFLPDITIGCGDIKDYNSIYALTVHELAHASHYMSAGKEYWQEYIKYILRSFVYENGSAYGNGHGEGAGYCEVGEMWAYFMESALFRDRYGGSMPDVGTSYWFRPQILRYLYERGMTRGEMFKALKPSVTSAEDLEDELITLYPERETQIRQVFNRYARS